MFCTLLFERNTIGKTMNKQNFHCNQKNINAVSLNKGIGLLNRGPNRSTGFAVVSFSKDESYEDNFTSFYYILIVLTGKIKLSCKLYQNKIINENSMVFVPKDGILSFISEENSEVMFFAFTTTIIRTEKDILNYFCTQARKFKYSFNTLEICHEMKLVVDMIRTHLLSQKLTNETVCEAWNTIFFHTIQSFYNRSKVIAFMRPLLSSTNNFETFIENNYIESAGNVSSLIHLSGIPPARFHSLFYEKYGMTAKNWLDKKAKQRILSMASEENITVTDMAKVFNVSTQRFCGLCRRLFDCTPGELIAKERERISL